MGGNRYVLQSDAGKLTIAGTFAFLAGNNRSLLLQGDGDGDFNLPITQATPVVKNGAGTWTTLANNTYTGGTTVNGGVLVSRNFSNGPLAINAGGTALLLEKVQANDPSGTTTLPTLDIAGAPNAPVGTFDVSNNSMIVNAATPQATIESLDRARTRRRRMGCDRHRQQHLAIRSTTRNHARRAQRRRVQRRRRHGHVRRLELPATDTLVKYTWNGDADFNGVVNFDDYVRTDVGFNTHLTGWTNGDYNYDGVVNFDDYVLIDVAFNTQTGTLARAMSYVDGSDRATER